MAVRKQIKWPQMLAIMLTSLAVIVALMYVINQTLQQRRVKELIENQPPGSELLPQGNVGGETEYRQFEQQ